MLLNMICRQSAVELAVFVCPIVPNNFVCLFSLINPFQFVARIGQILSKHWLHFLQKMNYLNFIPNLNNQTIQCSIEKSINIGHWRPQKYSLIHLGPGQHFMFVKFIKCLSTCFIWGKNGRFQFADQCSLIWKHLKPG